MTFHYKEDEIKQEKPHIYYLRKVFKWNKKVKPAKIIRSKVFESKPKFISISFHQPVIPFDLLLLLNIFLHNMMALLCYRTCKDKGK